MQNALTLQPVDDDHLSMISDMAASQLALEAEVARLETELEETKKRLERIRSDLLPDLILARGIREVRLANGNRISVGEVVEAHISEANAPAAMQWLRDTKNASIIKSEIKCSYGKDEQHKTELLVGLLRKHDIDFTQKEAVHPQTLKAFIRRLLRDGTPFPMKAFGVFIGNRTVIN